MDAVNQPATPEQLALLCDLYGVSYFGATLYKSTRCYRSLWRPQGRVFNILTNATIEQVLAAVRYVAEVDDVAPRY